MVERTAEFTESVGQSRIIDEGWLKCEKSL